MNRIIEKDIEKILDRVDLSELKGKSILITGSTGMIGTYLMACLDKIYPIEIYTTKYDLSNYIIGEHALLKADYIIHAAGYAQPSKYLLDPIKTLKINTTVTHQLLDRLNLGGKFLFISTGQITNMQDTNHPRACYLESKRCGEVIVNAYRSKGIDAKSARLSLAYGPGTRANDTRAMNSFIQQGIINKSIDLLDDGKAKRTYCYISDAIEMLWNILLHGKESVYNIGGRSKTTIGDLAKQIGYYLDAPVNFSNKLSLLGSPEDENLDISKYENEFGDMDFTPLKTGLINTIEWQEELYKKEV